MSIHLVLGPESTPHMLCRIGELSVLGGYDNGPPDFSGGPFTKAFAQWTESAVAGGSSTATPGSPASAV
jgi:hypothetical protein